MFQKLLSVWLLACLTCFTALAGEPVISNGNQTTWYFLRFMKGQNVLEAKANGAEVKTAGLTGADAQLWKIEGSEAEGYTLTAKSGQVLYTTTTQKEGRFHAAAQPQSQNTKFVWSTSTCADYPGSYVLSPKANTGVFMNQWGGAGNNMPLGLWNAQNDPGNAFEFVSYEEWQNSLPKYALIPYPKKLTEGEGKLEVKSLKGYCCDDAAAKRYTADWAAQLKRTAGIELKPTETAGANCLTMTTDAKLKHEAYTLKITTDKGIQITAADSTGFFYALQTLKQLLPNAIYGTELKAEAAWSLPCLDIVDEPQLGHRGFMLDVARHFFSKAEVKRVLDVMAAYKMNRFHWHLTDDQGWRVQIPEYPLLTEVGSIRKGSFTNAGGSKKFFDDTEYGRGMWYSLDDLREIVAYAKERQIEILPEIDLPGHMVAVVASYPVFSCDPSKKYEVRIDGGISKDVLNIGKDTTVTFLKCVLGHIAEVFPYPYVHIGGDECPTDQWANNPDCLKRVKDKGLKGVHELQSWLVEELGLFLKDKYNKDLVVWDELLAHWTADNKVKPVVMAWNSIGHSAQAADKGFKSIVVPYQSLYLDFMQVPDDQTDINEGYQGGWSASHVNTVEEAYMLNPVASLQGREDYCVGVQGNLWTETCSDSLQLEYQLLPRMLALSETGWLPAAEKDWAGFYHRLQSHDEVLGTMGYTFAKHYFIPTQRTEAEVAIDEVQSILKASLPGKPGFPAQAAFDKLDEACKQAVADANDANIQVLQKEIAAYKKAPITQPTAGKMYQLVSASTYFKAKYAGSTAYTNGRSIRFHYTPQTEPEELWQFVANGNDWLLVNMADGKQVTFPNANGANLTLGENGTSVRIDLATKASAQYTYVPGAVTISAVMGYNSANVRRFYGDCTGFVKADANGAICFPGTWYIREVTDFTAQLAGLVKKGQYVLLNSTPGETGEPTADALDFLANEVVTPAAAAVKEGNVTQEVYTKYLDLYAEFMAMPRTSAAEGLDEGYYYRIRNAYFTNYYAAVNASGNVAPKTLVNNDKSFYWVVKKNNDGSVKLTNAKTGKTAYPANTTADANVMMGKDYDWMLEEITTDQGQSGIAIVEETGALSWYTNPSNWANNVIMKPKDWGASIWTFEKLDIAVGITAPTVDNNQQPTIYYDLQGRRVANPTKGIFITNHGEKVLK